jgi:hypothetical protein
VDPDLARGSAHKRTLNRRRVDDEIRRLVVERRRDGSRIARRAETGD